MTVLEITQWDWDRLTRECDARWLPHHPILPGKEESLLDAFMRIRRDRTDGGGGEG